MKVCQKTLEDLENYNKSFKNKQNFVFSVAIKAYCWLRPSFVSPFFANFPGFGKTVSPGYAPARLYRIYLGRGLSPLSPNDAPPLDSVDNKIHDKRPNLLDSRRLEVDFLSLTSRQVNGEFSSLGARLPQVTMNLIMHPQSTRTINSC